MKNKNNKIKKNSSLDNHQESPTQRGGTLVHNTCLTEISMSFPEAEEPRGKLEES